MPYTLLSYCAVYTLLGCQLDKPRLSLVATNRVHVNIAVIINVIVLYILASMYLLEIKLLLLLLLLLLVLVICLLRMLYVCVVL